MTAGPLKNKSTRTSLSRKPKFVPAEMAIDAAGVFHRFDGTERFVRVDDVVLPNEANQAAGPCKFNVFVHQWPTP